MVRTQIQITEQQARFLRQKAHDDRVSLSEIIRRAIDQAAATEQAKRDDLAAKYVRAQRFIGSATPLHGETDIAENHDRYLNEGSRW
ncbi:MAG: ribbon-helix-helix protein, CopG family [Acidobacteria bacterium]|nr:MAG: ribbon-helix-helix protein, CopG family [Acidobacteriota bacterium]